MSTNLSNKTSVHSTKIHEILKPEVNNLNLSPGKKSTSKSQVAEQHTNYENLSNNSLNEENQA
jgi:hypothetical protein